MDERPLGLSYSSMGKPSFRDQVQGRLAELEMTVAELARRSGVSSGAIYKLLQRPTASTSAERARAIADALNLEIPTDETPTARAPVELGFTDSDDLQGQAIALVPVYNVEASAGAGLIPPDDEVIAYRLELPADYLRSLTDSHPDNLQVISVKGVSMLPTLKPGDQVMIDRAKTSLTYDGLFVIDVDGAILVKRIGRSAQPGFVTVISDNPDQPPFERATRNIRVLGKVVWAGVKL